LKSHPSIEEMIAGKLIDFRKGPEEVRAPIGVRLGKSVVNPFNDPRLDLYEHRRRMEQLQIMAPEMPEGLPTFPKLKSAPELTPELKLDPLLQRR
jgi:hypothetical protein